MNTSYWQQGCDDAKARRPARPPFPNFERHAYHERLANESYANGYRWGLHYEPTEDEGSFAD